MTNDTTNNGEIQTIIDGIDKDCFDLCDSLLNAEGALEGRPNIARAQEYLKELPPKWSQPGMDILDVSKAIRTDKLRDYISSLQQERDAWEKDARMMREVLERLTMTGGGTTDICQRALSRTTCSYE